MASVTPDETILAGGICTTDRQPRGLARLSTVNCRLSTVGLISIMSDDAGRDLLVRGIAAAKAGSRYEARFFLEKFLRQGNRSDARIQAWRYLADITDDPDEKKEYLGLILASDPLEGLVKKHFEPLTSPAG